MWGLTDEEFYAIFGIRTIDLPTYPITAPERSTDMHMSNARIAQELRDLEAGEAVILRRKELLLEEVNKRAALPKEPDVHSIIHFHLQYTEGGILYKVVAFRSNRAGASWHTTSKNKPGPYSWDDMLDMMQSDFAVREGHRTLEFFLYKNKGEWVR